MEDHRRRRRSSYDYLDKPKDISGSFRRDETYQVPNSRAAASASSAQQSESRSRHAPGILKMPSSNNNNQDQDHPVNCRQGHHRLPTDENYEAPLRRSIRFAPQQPRPVSKPDSGYTPKWIYLPEDDVYVLGCQGKPNDSASVRNQEMSGALPVDYHSAREIVPEVIPRSNNVSPVETGHRDYLAALSHPDTIFFSRKNISRHKAASRPDKNLFSQVDADIKNPALRSPASLIDWIMEGYDEGQRSRDILRELIDMLTEEL